MKKTTIGKFYITLPFCFSQKRKKKQFQKNTFKLCGRVRVFRIFSAYEMSVQIKESGKIIIFFLLLWPFGRSLFFYVSIPFLAISLSQFLYLPLPLDLVFFSLLHLLRLTARWDIRNGNLCVDSIVEHSIYWAQSHEARQKSNESSRKNMRSQQLSSLNIKWASSCISFKWVYTPHHHWLVMYGRENDR